MVGLQEIEDSETSEFDESKFYALLINKQHAELTQVLKNVATTLNTKPDNSELVRAIDTQTRTINAFISQTNSVLTTTKTEPENNNNEITIFNDLSQKIIESMNKTNHLLTQLVKPKTWEFTLNKTPNGFTNSITAKQLNS
jgi:hypothetical protein